MPQACASPRPTTSFYQAKKRFDESWDRDDPAHPINDAEEVRRATQWLRLGREQMAKVSADLQNIAATLAEAQRSGHVSISGLNGRLVQLDNTIAAEIAQAQADGVNLDWSALKTAAIDATGQSLNEMTAVRDAYGSKLDEAELDMAADGYDMDAVAGAEGEGDPSAQDQATGAAEKYDQTQRAADEALVNSGGPMTPEKQAAAARLRDFATVNDPNANPYAKQYAGERLNDYNMSRFVGPLPVDPVLGTDARQQARPVSSSSRSWSRDSSVRRRCHRMPPRRTSTAPKRRPARWCSTAPSSSSGTWACPNRA